MYHHAGMRATGVDSCFDVDVGVRFEAAGGARGGHATREIEARKAEGVFVVNRDAAAREIEEVLVHADQARYRGVAVEIEHLRAGGNYAVPTAPIFP